MNRQRQEERDRDEADAFLSFFLSSFLQVLFGNRTEKDVHFAQKI
jgi:hypothetical protein